jgi:hypothetical protein
MTEPEKPQGLIPKELRDARLSPMLNRDERMGWVSRGSVKVDTTWRAFIEGGPKSQSYPSLHRNPDRKTAGRQPADGAERAVTPFPLFMTIRWDPDDLSQPSEVIVRIVDPTFKFMVNWKPRSHAVPTLASDPGHFVEVTKIIPYDEEWEPAKGP